MFDMKCDGVPFSAEVCTGLKIALHKSPHNLFHSYLSIPSLPPRALLQPDSGAAFLECASVSPLAPQLAMSICSGRAISPTASLQSAPPLPN